jgi:hypothetical protein
MFVVNEPCFHSALIVTLGFSRALRSRAIYEYYHEFRSIN